MNTMFRILVILVVAVLIGGVIYSAVNAMPAQGGFDAERSRPEGRTRPTGERENFEGGMMLPFGVVKSLVLMSVVGVPYFFWRKRKK